MHTVLLAISEDDLLGWDAIGTTVALLGVTVSMVLTMVGWRAQARRAKAEADRAERALVQAQYAADRKEAAAALSIDYLEKISAAIESLGAQAPSESASAGQVPPLHLGVARPTWRLNKTGDNLYPLTNAGSGTAYDVEIDAHTSLRGPDRIEGGKDVQPGSAVVFEAERSPETTDSTVTVTWSSAPGDTNVRDMWRYPLPSPTSPTRSGSDQL
jgi:hypothetical protein